MPVGEYFWFIGSYVLLPNVQIFVSFRTPTVPLETCTNFLFTLAQQVLVRGDRRSSHIECRR